MATARELPVLPFVSALAFERWLSEYYNQFDGVWIKMAQKTSGVASVTLDEALEVALCYGWIDGQRNSYDDTFFLQKFTPRRPKSLWSKQNIAKIAALIAAGRMKQSGLAEVEAAKLDGRWQVAFASSKNMAFPEDFLKALEKNKQAQAYFNTLSKSSVYAIAWRLETVKRPATRQRRFDALLAMLEKGEFH